jgi:hypothetical protein
VLFLATATVAGITAFLTRYHSHGPAAVIGFVVAMLATLSLCVLTFFGGRLVSVPLANSNALGGFPFPAGTTWVYSRVEYQQLIGDPTSIITATRLFTDTVLPAQSDLKATSFALERTVSEGITPPGWWGSSVVNPGEYRYLIEGNQLFSVIPPGGQKGSLLYDFPLVVDKSWCPQQILPDNLPSCHMNGLRTVENRTNYATPVGTFDECYEISEEFNSGGVWEWFCNGIGTVARKYDHSGTRFGFQDTLVFFARGASPP